MRVLCFTENEDIGRRLEAEYQAPIICVSTVPELLDRLRSSEHSGIILDVRKMVRTKTHEKQVLMEFIESFPVLRVNYLPETDELRGLGSMESFFKTVKEDFMPRTIRRNVRVTLHFPVLLSRLLDRNMEQAEKTYTLNVSDSGLFIFTVADWQEERWGWVVLPHLEDETPILVRKAWSRPWGKKALSGIGVLFARMKKSQRDNLYHKFLLLKTVDPMDTSEFQEELDAVIEQLDLPPDAE